MNFKKLTLFLLPILLAVSAAGLYVLRPVVADATTAGAPSVLASVTPVFVPGNPNCAGLGYAFGFKPQPEPPPSGTYFFGDPVTNPAHTPTGDSVTISSDGNYFDWTSTLGIDAVIVKGGPNANVYVYDPPAESFSDTGLHSPINPNNNRPFGISHIEFCYDFEVDVSKTAETSFTRTFGWTIDKAVAPDTWYLFTGDSGTSEYTITLTKDSGTDSDWAASGTITIDNNTPFGATITGVTDVISPAIDATVDCGVSFPHVLAAGGSLQCTYSTTLPDGSNRTNTAVVTTSGPVGGGQASTDVTFGDPTTLVNDSVNLNDSYAGNLGTFNSSGSPTYERTFTCDGDEGTHDNTATIDETGQSDNASVTVNCYDLDVTKDARTSFTRTWDWTVDKSADQTNLLLSEGQLFEVNYEVDVMVKEFTDSDWTVTGIISVTNPAPIAAIVTGVSDVVSPNIVATVDCGVTFPYNLDVLHTLTCFYSTPLPDGSNRTNNATATLQNYAYDKDGVGTPNGTTDFSGSADVAFDADNPTQEIDECVDVSDTNVGFLGTVCATDAPQKFNYSLWFGAHPDADVILACGDNTHTNMASVTGRDSDGELDKDDWTVNANVACVIGCTLTPGYWKTHSEFGPAPYDDTWAQLPNGASTPFFLSGQTYHEVLWTPPKGGNAYYILAHAYIAAELNFLNGADPSAAQVAFDAATALFQTYSPDQVAALKGKNGNAIRQQFIDLAGTLDAYNNGLIGPGHCDE